MKMIRAAALAAAFCVSAVHAQDGAPVLLVDGDPQAGEARSGQCAGCHGPQGNSNNPQFPSLAGQHATYLLGQLQDYKSGERENAIMQAQVAGLSEQDMKNLAAYYASQTPAGNTVSRDRQEEIDLGRRLYRAGDTKNGIASCMACHGPAGDGNAPAAFPRLAGQPFQYTEAQLKAFRAGERDNDSQKMMRMVTERMTDKEIAAVAYYLQGLTR